MKARTAVLIAGPTASGKSAAALSLARAIGGEIVNADSMQVYRDLRVLTARPSPEEEARAAHHLYGHVDAARRYSVGAWLSDVQSTLEEIWTAGRVPIVTGGTGLYFRALEEGLAQVPPIPEEIRARVATWFRVGGESLLREKARAEGLNEPPQDAHRLMRALEVKLATGRPLAAFHGGERPALPRDARVIRLFIAPERSASRERIATRFHAMLERGAVAEVERLLARGLDPELPAMKAHGVRNIGAALRGEITMAEAAEGAIAETRQYAKRQMTWARKYMRHWLWTESPEAAAKAALKALRET